MLEGFVKPYYSRPGCQIFHGDAREVLPELDDKSVHCVVTSPPYWGLRDYGTAEWKGGDPACGHKAQQLRRGVNLAQSVASTRGEAKKCAEVDWIQFRDKCEHCGAVRMDSQLGLERTPAEYVAKMVDVFREVWRVLRDDGTLWLNMGDCYATGAGSVSFDLQLVDDATNSPMTVQLIAVDGVAVHLPQDTTPGAMVQMAGGRFRVVPCPDVTVIGATVPICVNEIVMMPSARTEFWVTYRDAAGRVAAPPRGASATLKMVGLTMGTGDAWPAVDLAKVLFNQSGPRQLTSNRVVVDGNTDAAGLNRPGGIFKSEVPGASALAAKTNAAEVTANATTCAPLQRGHRRRIFFGFSDVAVNNTFALGYEEVDERGQVVPGTQKPVPDQLERFDPARTTVCLPLGPGQTPVQETWELVQLSTENHNFHIHQTRFSMTDSHGGVLQDNLPLGVAAPDSSIANQVFNNQNGVCTIAQWRSGHCVSPAKVFDIPFAELGEFVYHCHILEHEDGGMMARIRVVPAAH